MLVIKSLSAGYRARPVLAEINLSLAAGEVLAVAGPNGAGKSTLLRAIAGTLPLSSGRVLLGGEDLAGLSCQQRARRLAVVPQAGQLPAVFTVYQTVLLGRTPHLNWLGGARPQDHAIVAQALEDTQLAALANRPVGELSGGEQQRVLLARALAQDAPVLLMDEPTTYLDLRHQSILLTLVRQLAVNKNRAVMVVLHDLNLAALFADRVALLDGGRLLADGTPAKVLTADLLTSLYQTPVQVLVNPETGLPLVLPLGKEAGQTLSPFDRAESTPARLFSGHVDALWR